MSNAAAIRVGPNRPTLSKRFAASRPHAPHVEWAPAPKVKSTPASWNLMSSSALAWAMVQVLVRSDSPPRR